MAVFHANGKKFYIDGRLKQELDEKVIPDLAKKDKDHVVVVDGYERAGKSVFAMILGLYAASQLGSTFDLTNICMTPEEFRARIQNAKKREVIIYDEAHRGMASSRFLSEINQILRDLMMEMGQKNLFVMIILPTFFLLDKYAALYRARGMFHIYENKRRRGFWVYFNMKNKKNLYMKGKKEFNYNCMKWPSFRGRFYDQYAVDEQEYRKKKADSFINKARLTKAEIFIQQRDLFVYILHKELKISTKKLADMYKYYNQYGFRGLKREVLRDILYKFKEKYGL